MDQLVLLVLLDHSTFIFTEEFDSATGWTGDLNGGMVVGKFLMTQDLLMVLDLIMRLVVRVL